MLQVGEIDMDKKLKKEASVPVQSRVSLMCLAEMDSYWTRNGHHIRTMSQLVSWSVELAAEVLKANGMMPRVFESVAEANNYMKMRGLYQGSLAGNKQIRKIARAVKFESMRDEGVNPAMYDKRSHDELHNRISDAPHFDGIVSTGKHSDLIDKAFEKLAQVKEEERKEQIKKDIERARASGFIVDENKVRNTTQPKKPPEERKVLKEGASESELDEYDRQREARANEQLKALNEIDELPFVGEKKDE